MGYPLITAEGNIVSWGSANFYSVLLSRIASHTATINVRGDVPSNTLLSADQASYFPGLKEWDIQIRSRWNSAVKLGNVGLLAFSSGGYAQHVQRYEITFRPIEVHDITALLGPSSPVLWKLWRPDILTWDVRFSTLVDSTTAIPTPHDPTATLPTLTLTYGDEATDDTLAGSVVLQQLGHSMETHSIQRIEWQAQGVGALTPAGTTSAFGTSALGIPLWSEGGAAAGAIEIDVSTTATFDYVGTDSFYRSITLRCAVGEPVEIDIDVQGVGVLTMPA